MTIGELARAAGLGVETIRFYQRRGLVGTPARGQAGLTRGIRRYEAEHLRTLRFIRSAQGAGFTLEEIGELLRLDATQDRPRARALAADRLAALDRKIADLEAARTALRRLASACAESDDGPCPILAAFD
ncbi:MerR family transcriptional regulator [Sphingomonas abaci]|uniref:MerR family mercuric resistance operon transcriptional regulator n=1 Tax=Sphingomonas abaci TaxID=237611 RepID=A0A7W7EXC2_9SPHN|nr:MerR family transcriptional regulator [Sphingomonas abaci]MBB4617553.1 MerR family mercuric resistance operon transcriptional regulator [Sphingomonas abaci]